jgi:hypothetical protein
MRFSSTFFVLAWIGIVWPVAAADNLRVIEIWPGRVP